MGTIEANFTVDQICQVLGAPRANVATFWPAILAALEAEQLADRLTAIAVIATVGVETGSFAPIHEIGTPERFEQLYGNRPDLGNIEAGDGARYHGRGFIQLTGRANYRAYGRALGVALEDEPDLALDPAIAARVLVQYFKDRAIEQDARRRDWEMVRRKVNGGLNGWPRFKEIIDALELVPAATLGMHVSATDMAMPHQFQVARTGGDGLLMHEAPGVGTPLIPPGIAEGVTIAGEEFAWRRVRDAAGNIGWVADAFLELVPAATRSVARRRRRADTSPPAPPGRTSRSTRSATEAGEAVGRTAARRRSGGTPTTGASGAETS
jgi:predicted chitinase